MSIFNETQANQAPDYSTFDMSHQNKFTCAPGKLVPTMVSEVIPGDDWNINLNQLCRFQPMISPVMHQARVKNYAFYVPMWLCWQGTNYEKFFTGGDDGMAQVAFPTITGVPACTTHPEHYKANRLADYLGLPPIPVAQNDDEPKFYDQINPFPFIAYALVYYEYFRSEWMEPFTREDLDITRWTGYPNLNFSNLTAWQQKIFMEVKNAGWMHDYFTSALPSPQKGQPVTMPLGDTAPIITKTNAAGGFPYSKFIPSIPTQDTVGSIKNNGFNGTDTSYAMTNNSGIYGGVDNSNALLADLSQANSATIIEMRKAIVLQQFLERRSSNGSRYVEYIKSDFRVTPDDGRSHRPEYCGENQVPILISEVLQTSQSNSSSALGDMAGHGIAMGGSALASKYCKEHGFMIVLSTVMPVTGYNQGLPRLFKKFDKFDYAHPMFEHIGEMAVKNREIYYTGNNDEDADDWGYVPQFADYKFMNNRLCGDFRNILSSYVWDRKFNKLPPLNSEFIASQPSRHIFAIEDEKEDPVLIHQFFEIHTKRKLSFFSSPSIERI